VTAAQPRPEIARASAALVRAVTQLGTVSAQTKELCALMVAWLNGCDRCVSAHTAYAARLGVKPEKLEALSDYAHNPLFDERQRAALSAAVALTREPRALPPAVSDALRAHFDEGEIYEILSAIGVANYLTRVNNALADDAVEVPCVPPPGTIEPERDPA